MKDKINKLIGKEIYFTKDGETLKGVIKEFTEEINKDLIIICLINNELIKLSFYNCFSTAKLVCLNKEDNNLAIEICNYIKEKDIEENDSERILREAKFGIESSDPSESNLRNVAYKAKYCDGKFDNPSGEWFTAPCSKRLMEQNCSKKDDNFCYCSICKSFLQNSATTSDLIERYNSKDTGAGCICYEANLFREWIVRAGRFIKGDKPKGWNVEKNSVVFITTLPPGTKETYRIIIGAFLVKNSFDRDLDNNKEAFCVAHEAYRIMTKSSDESHIAYWAYANSKNGPEWNEGLIRYVFTDEVAAAILKKLVEKVRTYNDSEKTGNAEAFFEHFVRTRNIDINKLPKPNGCILEWI